MAITRTEIEQAGKRCFDFMVDAVQWDYTPHPNTLLPPLRRFRSHPTSHGETAPLVCAVKRDRSAAYSLGTLQTDQYGSFYPLRIKGDWEFLFASRTSGCEITVFEDQDGDTGTYQWLKKSYRYDFKKDGITKAIYDIEWEARYSYTDGTRSNIIIGASKVYLAPDSLVIWAPNRIIDGIEAPHWRSSRGSDRAAFVSPGFEAQGHLLRWKSGLLRSGAHLFGNQELWNPLGLGGRVLDAAIATDEAYKMYFAPIPEQVTFWSSLIGHQDKGMIQFSNPVPDPGHYIHHHGAIRGDLALDNDPRDSISFKKYVSRIFNDRSQKIYLSIIWPQSPYNHSLEAVDRCLRFGPDGLDGPDGALAWLDRCNFSSGSGIQIARQFPIKTYHEGRGETEEHLEGPSPLFLGDWRDFTYKRGHSHVHPITPVEPVFGPVPTPYLSFHSAYSSNWLAIFCYAATICYQYAKSIGHARTNDLGDYAKQSAELLISLQYIGETIRVENDKHHETVLELPNVCSYGAFPFGYNFDDQGNPFGLGVVTEIQAIIEGVMRIITPFDQQDPFPVVKGFAETVWLVLGAFTNMLATDLV